MCDIFTPTRDSYNRIYIYTKTIKFNVVFVVWSVSENATRIYWFNPFPVLWFHTKFSFNEMYVGYVHLNNLAKRGQRITFMKIEQSKYFKKLNALCSQRMKFLIKLKLVIICIWQKRNLRLSKFKFTVTTLCWHLQQPKQVKRIFCCHVSNANRVFVLLYCEYVFVFLNALFVWIYIPVKISQRFLHIKCMFGMLNK